MEKTKRKKMKTAGALGWGMATRFQPGKSGNPHGRAVERTPSILARRLTRIDFEDVLDAALSSDEKALNAIIKHPQTSMMKLGVARALLNAVKAGDWTVLCAIVERLIGKPPTRVEVTGADGGPLKTTVMTPAERHEELKRLRALAKEIGSD